MNLNVQLSPGYLQKNIPEYEFYEEMNKNPFQYTCYENYIDNIKNCINFGDGFDNLEIKSFVSFNIQKMDVFDIIPRSNYHYVETKSGKFGDNIDYMSNFNIAHIKKILHSYESVITFDQYFKHENQHAYVIIMLCCDKKTLQFGPIDSIEPISELRNEFNNLKNDFTKLKKEFMSLKKKLSKSGK